MHRFDHYFRSKMQNAQFKTLYEKECNVCANTVKIFEKAEVENVSIQQLSLNVDTDMNALEALRDADYCDPHLVIRLCHCLGLKAPDDCPKLAKRQ